ncbi:hypothetical protein FIBSPDRAFT_886281 [Athelia psychrophila]|uniref:U1-type domain-containing protein n=1 Tax=Athelia psychrophila TaxID=1759441 RepID=A0A166QZ04_9AGAM|nr:hypothetical protein FIBSPDRAFT_886281 [Fibularhizoctonia sp. CBS 109695]
MMVLRLKLNGCSEAQVANANATCHCEICGLTVKVGTGRDQNFASHESSKAHQKQVQTAALKVQAPEEPLRKKPLWPTKMLDLFRRKSPSLPATLHLLVPPPLSTSLLSADSASLVLSSVSLPRVTVNDDGGTAAIIEKLVLNAAAEVMLQQLWLLTSRLPDTVPVGTPEDKLACFQGNPHESLQTGEDAWETLVHPAPVLIGYNEQSPVITQYVRWGKWGMYGFCQWVEVCLWELKVSTELLEAKLNCLCDVMQLFPVATFVDGYPFGGRSRRILANPEYEIACNFRFREV